MENFVTRLNEQGFAVIPDVFNDATISSTINELTLAFNSLSKSADAISGVRDLLNVSPQLKTLAESRQIRNIVEPFLGSKARVVRSIFFDKTPRANWKVAWHQDLTIAVSARKNIEGFTAWSTKSGIPHVQPPVSILENMLTVRIHLDDADETNGVLKVIPRSHRRGRLSADEIFEAKNKGEVVLCPVPKGGILLMRPLLLHASSAATAPSHRRVIHLEFSSVSLPQNLEWHV